MTISELLVPLDGSARSLVALPVAEAVARKVAASITAVSVCSPSLDCGPVLGWLDQRAQDRGAGTVAVIADDVPGSLLDLVAETPGVVPCMSSHGRSGLGRLVLGSVSARVVRESPRPVLLVGPRAQVPTTFGAVVVCVHGDPSRLASTVVEWAAAMGAVPWLVAVQDVEEPLADDTPAGEELRALEATLAAAGLPSEVVVAHGHDAAAAIVDLARQVDAALIIAATASRTGAAGVVLGSVAQAVVRAAPCPVLLLGPGCGAEGEAPSSPVRS